MADQDQRDPQSHGNDSGAGQPPPPPNASRRPVDDRAAYPAAPAPPPGYPWSPPKQKRGILGGFTKLVSFLAIVIVLFALGYYTAIITFLSTGNRVTTSLYQPGDGQQKVAVIPVEGMITDPTADFIRNAVDTVIEDRNVAAVVLRVDSGGGTVGASDRVYHELQRLRERRGIPVIASFGGYAASGGYYVACATDRIYAEPTCVTGSIGVIANVITFQGTFEELLKAQTIVETAETSKQKAVANSPLTQWGEDDKAELREILNVMHDRFREVVSSARMNQIEQQGARFADVTDGSVYMAREARENGLVDQIGYIDAAIDEAIHEGDFEVDNPPVVRYDPPMPLLQQLGVGVKSSPGVSLDELDGARLRRTFMEFSAPQIMYWYPGAG